MPYYIIYDDKNGNPCMGGGFSTRSRAEDELRERDFFGNGKVYYSKWYNIEKATRSIKHQRIKDLGMDDGSRNIRHNVSESVVLDV